LTIGIEAVLADTGVSPESEACGAGSAISGVGVDSCAVGVGSETVSATKVITWIARETSSCILIIAVAIGVGHNADSVSEIVSGLALEAVDSVEGLAERIDGVERNAVLSPDGKSCWATCAIAEGVRGFASGVVGET
jgi:hypothetical protein